MTFSYKTWFSKRISNLYFFNIYLFIYLFIICKIVKTLKMPSAWSAKAVSLVKNGHIIGFVPWDAG